MMYKKFFFLTLIAGLTSCATVPNDYQHYVNNPRVFSRNHIVCEIGPSPVGLLNTGTYITNPPSDTQCAGLVDMPSVKEYNKNPNYWNQRQGILRSRVLGVITPGTSYRIKDIGSVESGIYDYSIVIDSGALKGTTGLLTAVGRPDF